MERERYIKYRVVICNLFENSTTGTWFAYNKMIFLSGVKDEKVLPEDAPTKALRDFLLP